jgi:hypothetical protein
MSVDAESVGRAPSPMERRIAKGNEYREEAAQKVREARERLHMDSAEANVAARSALWAAASALNWLEDTELQEKAHSELDAYGRWTRVNVPEGCHLEWDGNHYHRTCPVDLSHTRVGFSVNVVGKRSCSLCYEDISECPHMPGYLYRVPGGVTARGTCRVCVRQDCTEHPAGQYFDAEPIAVITEGEIDEISLVGRPRQPDARIHSQFVSTTELCDLLRDQFQPGMPVSCDKCLTGCGGLHDPFGPGAAASLNNRGGGRP